MAEHQSWEEEEGEEEELRHGEELAVLAEQEAQEAGEEWEQKAQEEGATEPIGWEGVVPEGQREEVEEAVPLAELSLSAEEGQAEREEVPEEHGSRVAAWPESAAQAELTGAAEEGERSVVSVSSQTEHEKGALPEEASAVLSAGAEAAACSPVPG